jgi:uncharacterized membrane protein
MKNIMKHIRIYIMRGIFAIIPIFLTVLAIQLLYVLIDKRVMTFLERFIDVRHIPGLGILLVLIFLYLIGMIVSNVVGRQFFYFVEWVSQRVPIIKAVYHVGKQLSEGLSEVGDKQVFKKVLLVKWNSESVWVIAFVTGDIINQRTGETLIRVFVPHVPSPATGFIFIVKKSETIDPGWTVEEAIKMIVSGGIVSPKEIKNINLPV